MRVSRGPWSFAFPVVLVAFAAAGCGSNDSPTQPGINAQQNADDIAQQTAGQLAADNGGDMIMIESAMTAASVPGGDWESGAPASIASDTTFQVGNVTWTIQRTFYDAFDNPQDEYNPLTTVRMIQHGSATGSVTTERLDASYRHEGDWDVRGLGALQDTVIFNGQGHDTAQAVIQAAWRPATAYFHTTRAFTLADVLVHKDRDQYRWPLSGTATWQVAAERRRDGPHGELVAQFEVTVTVQFDGTQTPRLTVSGGYVYRVNLQTGEITREEISA
jgi:hypothetical protein